MTGRTPRREVFDGPDCRLSYLDYGGGGRPLVALHGHLNEASFVDPLVAQLGSDRRVIALDQRGHGDSEHPASYVNDRYVDDAEALLDHLGLAQVALLGHSLGGVVAYRLAARSPRLVASLVVVDIGAVVDDDIAFIAEWPRRTTTRAELVHALGALGPPHAYSMRHYPDGWGLPFDANEMIGSQQELNADRWDVWLASSVPTLLIRGTHSAVLTEQQATAMAGRRPNTRLIALEAGHSVHFDAPTSYARAVAEFLAETDSTG
jgi:esterase